MTCDELLQLMNDFVGDELVVEVRRTVEVHILGCERCDILVHSYTHTVRVAKALPRCGLPSAFEERLRKVLAPHLGEST